MYLTSFISDLITTEKIIVPGVLKNFTAEDDSACIKLLQEYYENDKLEMAHRAPVFSAASALWAAKYLYYAVQLTVIRDAEETVIQNKLQELEIVQTPDIMYSVDLIFRYLPALFSLAKGLSPSDPLVKQLQETVSKWPLSAPGIDLEQAINIGEISDDDFLWQVFIDRVIEFKNNKLIENQKVAEGVSIALGKYSKVFWPQFEDILNNKNEQQSFSIGIDSKVE